MVQEGSVVVKEAADVASITTTTVSLPPTPASQIKVTFDLPMITVRPNRGFSQAAPANATAPLTTIPPPINAILVQKQCQIVSEVARGMFSTVYKVARSNSNGEFLAVKVINLSQFEQAYREKYLFNELAAIIRSDHPNIVRLLEFVRCEQWLAIFMDYESRGTMAQWLKEHGALKEKQARFWFNQILQAMLHFHRILRLAHRNINLDNILLSDLYQAKLCDFSYAKECWDKQRHCALLNDTICGTLSYFSPQLLLRQPYNAFLNDCWAMGVVLYAMITNRMPFQSDDCMRMLHEQTTDFPARLMASFARSTSNEVIDLIVQLLEPKEESRITLHEANEHVWMSMGPIHQAPPPPPPSKAKPDVDKVADVDKRVED